MANQMDDTVLFQLGDNCMLFQNFKNFSEIPPKNCYFVIIHPNVARVSASVRSNLKYSKRHHGKNCGPLAMTMPLKPCVSKCNSDQDRL